MPTVSVITPTYNRPELLEQAIRSMLAQTFGDFEMLVVDDGSQVSAQAVVEGFGDARVRYIRQRHAGRSAARNSGLKAARGEFIAFLDDDDLYHPHKLAHETAFFYAHPDIDMVGSGFRLLNSKDEVLSIWEPWVLKPQLSAANCLYGCPLASCSVLMRRRALERMDHWFDPAFDRAQTDDFFLRQLLAGGRFAWLREILSDYRLMGERPMSIVLVQYKAYRQVLEKIFKRADLPPDIAGQRQNVLLHHTLNSAWRAYAYQLDVTAQRYLLRALIQEPRLADEMAFTLLVGLSAIARNTQYVRNASQYIDYVFDHLPAPLRNLVDRREEINKMISVPMPTAVDIPSIQDAL